MTHEEAQEILVLYLNGKTIPHERFFQAIKIAADALEKHYLPEGLDEAAEMIGYSFDTYDAFKDGAEWAFSQGETYETRVIENGLSRYKIVQHTVESFLPNEVVTIQIRKK